MGARLLTMRYMFTVFIPFNPDADDIKHQLATLQIVTIAIPSLLNKLFQDIFS